MNISEILKKVGMKYNELKLKNLTYIIFENETMLVIIHSNQNVFKITRKDFVKIDDLLLSYDFCLINTSKDEIYYEKIIEPNNFLRKSFETTEKEEIYFGKQILQQKIEKDKLIKMIKNIGVNYYE